MANDQSEKIRKTLRLLPEERRKRRLAIIAMRGPETAPKATLQEIADQFGISKEAIRLQLKKGAEVRPSGAPRKEADRGVA